MQLSTANRLTAPSGLAAFSFAFFIACWCLPARIYTHYMGEPNLLFLDGATMLLFSLCVLGFWCGDRIAANPLAPRAAAGPLPATTLPPALWLSLPLIAGTVMTVISSIIIVRNNPSVLLLMFAGELGQEKNNLDLDGSFSLSASVLTGVVWWATYRLGQLNLSPAGRRFIKLQLFVAVSVVLVSSSLKLARGELMPIIAGLAIVQISSSIRNGKAKGGHTIRNILIGLVAVVGLFSLFSFLRGISEGDRFVRDLLGYSVSSYNRLAAVVNGTLHYPFAGKGIYLSSFVTYNESFNRLIPLARIFDWPSFTEAWSSEFSATWNAGLNGFLIWSGTFGYLFSDLGWFTPALLAAYGYVYRLVWNAYCSGATWAIVLYPWFAFCVLFWFGTNFLLDTKGVVLLLTGLGLTAYERLTANLLPGFRPPLNA